MGDPSLDSSVLEAKAGNSDRIPIVLFGVILLLWPFVMFGLAFCDDESVFLCRDPIYGYTVVSCLAYPFFYLVAVIWGSRRKRAGANSASVMAVSCIPLLSAYPWVLLYFAFALS